jgi:hypothetical protein
VRIAKVRRLGFTLATSMCLIAIAAVAMTAVCSLLRADIRRTLNGAADAQLRQLLIAAQIDAPSHLSDAAQQEWETRVPPSLGAARVSTRRLDAAGAVFVRAAIADRAMTEELHFQPSGRAWLLSSAALSPGCSQH